MLLSEGLHILPGFDHYHSCGQSVVSHEHPSEHQHGNNTGQNSLDDGIAVENDTNGENCPICEFVSLCQSGVLPHLPHIEFNVADDFVSPPVAFCILQLIFSVQSRAPPVFSLV
ncbi:MAG: hypothetical protein LBJ67_05410 [Planctomycetaceae bacterium]|nr:hypothetical protein [Planctomycetaceae bacterium]